MKRITKRFKTLRQAGVYQTGLYEKYDSVKLVSWPRFSEEGLYTWEVRG